VNSPDQPLELLSVIATFEPQRIWSNPMRLQKIARLEQRVLDRCARFFFAPLSDKQSLPRHVASTVSDSVQTD